jgi:hypothetical protein
VASCAAMTDSASPARKAAGRAHRGREELQRLHPARSGVVRAGAGPQRHAATAAATTTGKVEAEYIYIYIYIYTRLFYIST